MIDAMSSSNAFRLAMLAPKFWLSWLAVALAWGVARLPLSWMLALGRGLGHLAFYLAGSRRRIAKVNIDLCFPELTPQQRTQLLKDNLLHTGMGLTRSDHSLAVSPTQSARACRLTDWNIFTPLGCGQRCAATRRALHLY